MLRYISFAFIIFLLSGCYTDDYINYDSPKIVVDGWIEDGLHPYVLLSLTIEPSEERKNIKELSDNIVHWAKVTVSDGENTAILTGKYDKRYFPPYVFTTPDIIGRTGGTYTLTVDYKDYHATATTTIPPTVPIKKVTQHKKENSDSLYSVSIEFDDPENNGNYYQIFSNNINSFLQPIPTYLGVMSDDILNRNIKTDIYPGHVFENYAHYDLFFHKGQSILIRLSSIDKQSYDYWHNYSDALSFGRNYLIPYTKNLSSNIRGGLGYWCGYGSDKRIIIIGD